MAKRVGDVLADVVWEAGVQRIYVVSGDSTNGITDVATRTLDASNHYIRAGEGLQPLVMNAVLTGRADEVIDLAKVNLLR